MTSGQRDARVFYRDVKPYEAPARQAELAGPRVGRVELPVTVYWGPPYVFDLASPSDVVEMYEATLQEGRAADQVRLLNWDVLVSVWPRLVLPARVRRLWEDRFPELTVSPV